MKKIFTLLFAVLLLSLVCTSAWAQLTDFEEGAVYRFVNRSTGRALNAGEDNNGALYVNAATVVADDLKQQWYVTKNGDYYVLRNLHYAKYLKGAITNKVPWSLTDYDAESSNFFSLVTSATSYNTLETKDWADYGFMHDDGNSYNGGYRVVSWENGDNNTSSHWTIYKVEYTDEELKEVLEERPTTEETLNKRTANFVSLFNEGACYTPKYKTLAEAQASDGYLALEDEFKELADKIYNKALTIDGWAEDNADTSKEGWESKYAKKFRVQMYEPYSIAGDITGFLRMNAHSNNDNPTGIYVYEPGTVYVMVEGAVKDGASLRLHRAGSNSRITNATGAGYALTTGLNVINITEVTEGGDHLYICYNVDTYNPNGETVAEMFPHKLSEYAPLKIHIEGGAINGFYNACGDFRASAPGAADDLWFQNSGASYDCDADWVYMEERANLAVLPIVSNRQVMLFQLEDTNGHSGTKTLLPESVTVPTVPNYFTEDTPTWDDYGMGCDPETGKINIWMETWDRIMYAELATLGLIQKSEIDKMNQFYPRWNADGSRGEIYNYDAAADGVTYQDFCRGLDYSEYYNHHGVALGTESGFMSAGWNAANYNINTLSSLVTMAGSNTDGVNNYAVDIWGPAHEIGHQFQDVFNIRGGTEVTNNVFSNAAVWYQGAQTSRYNWGGLDSVLSSFNSGAPFIDYNIWSMTQMFYKLWLYYHLAGNNTQFYPRFFEMLRIDPLNAKGATANGTESMLKIYEKMCDAAGEDLTEFFRAHGFFVLLDNYPKEDYGTTIFTQTQEEVDAAISRVKAKYDKENYAVLLINDLTTEILCHDGVNKRKRFDGTPASEYGTVDNFINGTDAVANGGTYTATMNSDETITMEGEGGIGFLIFDETGKLVSFSYNSEFALSDEALETIMTGNATIVSVGTDVDAEPVSATVDLAAMQKDILGALIAKAQPIVDKIDDTYKKVGFYKAAAVEELAKVLEYAKEVYAGSSGYEAAYDLLYAEYKNVEANTDAKVNLDLNKKYIISNNAYSTRNIAVDGTTVYALENSTGTAAQWSFVESGTAGRYYLKNADGYYCPAVVTGGTGGNATTEQTNAGTYELIELEHGLWAIQGTSAPMHASSSQNYNIVGWTYEATASQWYITSTETDETAASLSELQKYINKTETLLNEVLGTVTYTRGDTIPLRSVETEGYHLIWTNAQETSEGPIANLVDGKPTTYFHSDWHAENVSSGDHYVAVDLGADNTLERFAFSHTTRAGVENDFPKSVDVYGSDDNVTYKYLGSASGMPQTAGTSWQFEGVMVASHRYLRFNMHASRGYWHLAEFDIMPVTGFSLTVNDTYSGTVTVETVTAAMEALFNGKGVAFSMSPEADTVTERYKTLKETYDALYGQYEATITARKNTLKQLAADTQTLINQAGTVQLAEVTPIKLTESNFYCNAPYIASNNADYSADYVTYLTDGNLSTKLHTRWNANSDDGDYHYLRVDMGEGESIDKFKFTYTTASRGKKDMPLTMIVEGANEIDGDNTTKDAFTEITTLTPLPEVLNENTVYKSLILGSTETPYRYLRFKVTDITVDENDGNGHPFFTMAEFTINSVVEEEVTVNDTYKSNVSDNLLLSSVLVTNSSTAMSTNDLVTSVPLLDAQIADQQAAKDKLYAAMNNTAALKANLLDLIEKTQALYDKMATDDGAVEEYYSTSTLTATNLSEVLAEIEDAQEVYDNSSATVDVINIAYEELNVKYGVLNGIEVLNVADRSELNALITKMQGLLEETTVDGAVEIGNFALQIDDESAPFYIWSNAPASDCNNYSIKVQGLIDENNDGSANTGTFFGTDWGSHVDAYTHYIEIDMGVNTVLEDLSIDYTTRESGAADSRPNGLKFFGSNNKVDYEEFYTVTTDLPTDANTKWTMPAPLELTKKYRYVRIAVASPHGSCFNMADFNLYSHCTATVKDFYSTSGIFDCLPTAMRGYCDAKEAANVYLLETDYETAKTELQAQIDALQAIVGGNVVERGDLKTLIDETEPIVTEVATIDETETEIEMQCTNPSAPYYLYCNAEGKENGYDGDDTGVAALVGDNKDNTTHLHTAYEGSTDDDLDHYLRLDMGENEALASFKFSYTGRNNNNNNAPVRMVIEGSNDLASFEEIAVLDNLPTTESTVTYTTPEALTNGKAYRYIRFMVTKTKNGDTYNGHPYFVLSRFSVTACKTIEVAESYVSPNLPLSTLVKANNEVVDANVIVEETEHYVTETAYNTAKNELQDAKDALAAAIALKNIPVKLTTDVNNPVLYKIKINRSTTTVLEYDGATADVTKQVAVADEYVGNKYQAWYFMQGTDAESNDDILILPYWNEGAANTALRLGAASTGNAAAAVWAVESGDASKTKQNWYITVDAGNTAEGWWNIRPQGKDNYFSNNGGVGNKMGFWNNSSDDGSEFQFVLDETDYSLSDAYYALYNKYTEHDGTLTGGTAIGDYTEASVTEYNNAYNTAGTLLEAKASTDDEYNAARETLENEYATIEYVMPEEGKFYLIRSISTHAYCSGKYVHALCDKRSTNANQNHKHLVFDALGDIAQYPLAVFVFEDINANGECKMKNLHTGMYVKSFTNNAEHMTTDYESAATVKIGHFAPGQAILRIGDTAPMHAQEANSVIVHWAAAADNASLWSIDEVTDLSQIVHNVTMNATFSSVTLGYNAIAPAGVRVYNAKGIDSGYVTLEKIADGDEANNVIPANTPVILYRADDVKTKTFSYTEATATKPSESLLGGSLYTKYVECDDSDYYKLMIKSGEAKMYLMYKEFDANGNSLGETHDGGHIKCTANKIFMKVPGLSQAAVYSMRFINPETTDIDGVNAENGEEKTIYDLQGRKLTEITAPGIYIVNGKKVLVK